MISNFQTHSSYAIGLILFHPEKTLFNRLEQMVELGFRVYVFDNSPYALNYSSTILENHNICYLTSGKNVGIGFSLSTICATAFAHGFTQLLFLDQDTGITGQTLGFIESFSQALPSEANHQYAALVFSGNSSTDHSVQEVRLAISSGSLFNLSALKTIGWHNEKFFVDCVDYELCLRARRLGFKIGIVWNTPDFDHVTEQPDRIINLFGKQLLVRRYSHNRIKDAISAYLKLIIGGLLENSPSDTYTLIRSMIIYIMGQIIARFQKLNN